MRVKNFKLEVGSKIFKSFGEPARIRILHLLLINRQMCVSDLELTLGFTQTKISRHLAYLKNAGLLICHRDGHRKFYGLKSEIEDFTQQVCTYLKKDKELLEDAVNHKRLTSENRLTGLP